MKFDFSLPPAGDDFDPKAYAIDDRRARTPPGQTLAKKFPHLEYASIPQVDLEFAGVWPVNLCGEVGSNRTVTLDELATHFPLEQTKQDFHCITGWSLFDTEWQGVTGATLVREGKIEIADTVTTVLVHGRDEFSTCLWLEDFLRGMLAYGYRGRRLSPQHGFPLRFVAPPSLYQYKSCKWVTGIEFLTEHKLGFWEIRAYSDSADAWRDDRYANPVAAKGKSMGEIRRAVLDRGEDFGSRK